MVEAKDYQKERRTLLKLVGIKLVKRLKKNGVNPSGASAMASSFVDRMSDEEVLLKLEKLKRNQHIIGLLKSSLAGNRTGKELRELARKRCLAESKRVKRNGKS